MAYPPNIPPIQPHICVKGGSDAIRFYEEAFGARATERHMADDGVRIFHANLEMFGSEIMLHDEFEEFGTDVMAPTTRGGASMTINVNLQAPAEVDAAIERAEAASAAVILPAQDVFWGARYGKVRDPFGHVWAFNAALKPVA